MIADVRNTFASKVSCAAAAGTAQIGDSIDLGSVHRDIGQGKPVYLVITVDTEIFTGGSAGTVQFQFVSAATSTLTSSPTVHLQTAALVTGGTGTQAALAAGKTLLCAALPIEGLTYLEFIGILCVTATTTTTAGKINAFLTLDPAGYQNYKEGVN